MSKITLNDVTNIGSLSVINSNFDKIEQELQNKVLYRNNPTGEPNTVERDIDMNGNSLLNVGKVYSANGRWATIDEVEDIKDEVAANAVIVEANKDIAVASATAAATSYDNFDDRYLGQKTADPSVDNDGGLLLTGALYFRTSGTPIMRVYNGTTWQDVGSITTTTTNLIDSSLYSSQAEAEAGVNNTKVMTPLRVKNAIDKQVKEGFTSTGPIVLPGDASTALQAAPKQQVESVALSTVETYRGSDIRIAQLPETSYYDNSYSYMMAKLQDGRLVGWGRSIQGTLGTGNNHDGDTRTAFAQFAPKIPDGVTIAGFEVGSADSFVWLSNGWVYHTGANVRGVGGHGATGPRYMFTRINFFFTNSLSVTDVKMGSFRPDDQYTNATFLCSNGDVYFSGYSGGASSGTAGDGIATERNITTPVKCLVSNIVGISASSDSDSCKFAWRSDGTCYAWGRNDQGALGIGSTSPTSTPTLVSGVSVSKVVTRTAANSSNNRFTCTLFLLKDGTVKSAGYNNGGQLGDGTTANRTTPVTVTGLANIVDIGVGGGDLSYCWALTNTKRLKMWGWNHHYALGVGDMTNRTTPVNPIGWIDEADNQTLSGDPPFQGKIVKVITGKTVAGGPIGRQQTTVLDEDGNVWVSGFNDTNTVGWNGDATVARFKRAALMAVAPGDKIVDIHHQGHSTNGAGNRLFAITQQGKLLMSGSNSSALGTVTPNTGYWKFVFPQPVRLGV